MIRDVRVFMEACGLLIPNTPGFTDDNEDQALLYLQLIKEEFKELQEAHLTENIVEAADGCVDLIWVVIGYAMSLGINVPAVWKEIAESNMSKVVDGKVIRREDGKIMKPETYRPPNVRRALGLERSVDK